jgi:hypothetical protein
MITDATLLHIIQGVEVFQDNDPKARIHFLADLDVDADGAPDAYRLDNNPKLALDDIHASAGYPHGNWWDVIVRDLVNPDRPFVDENGFCISMTSYQRSGFDIMDRRRYLDASLIPFSVIPEFIRKVAKGTVLGCYSRVTDITNGKSLAMVTGDESGFSIGEVSLAGAQFFNKLFSPRNGDERKIYLYEFFPNSTITIGDETFELKPLNQNDAAT